MSTCTCDPGAFANGWHETRCTACALADRREWDGVWRFIADMRERGAEAVLADSRARSQWALWDYLGMDRAGAWR